MRTKQLLRALKQHRETGDVFLGVFASDKLPTRLNAPHDVALIANTDPSDKPGQHWCAFYITPACVYFFDSYGLPPITKSFRKLMRCRRKRRVFGRRLQGRGRVCGHYCMYFILAMARGGGSDMFARFGDDLDANDRIVRQEVMKNFALWETIWNGLCTEIIWILLLSMLLSMVVHYMICYCSIKFLKKCTCCCYNKNANTCIEFNFI